MMSDTQTATGFPLVIPTSTQQPLARLVLRNDLGQVIQQWLVKQNKCTLGSAASCSLRCTETGIAPYHALIVVGARQTFVRALAPKVTRDGVQVNEILLSENSGNFEIAGLHFELSRANGEGSRERSQQEASNPRLKFTLARPFELNKRSSEPTAATPPTSQRAADEPNAAWIAKLVQSAVEPLECQLHNMLAPLAELQAESRRQKRSRRQRFEAKRKQEAEALESGTSAADSGRADFINSALAQSTIESLAARQAASMETLGERISDIGNQLAAIERLAGEERIPEPIVDPNVEQKLRVQHEAIEQLQSGIVAVSSAIQDLHERRETAQAETIEWRSTIQRQLGAIAEGLSEAQEREPQPQESPIILAAIERLQACQTKSQEDIEAWKNQIQEQIEAIRSAYAESIEGESNAGQATREELRELKFEMLENLNSLNASLDALQTVKHSEPVFEPELNRSQFIHHEPDPSPRAETPEFAFEPSPVETKHRAIAPEESAELIKSVEPSVSDSQTSEEYHVAETVSDVASNEYSDEIPDEASEYQIQELNNDAASAWPTIDEAPHTDDEESEPYAEDTTAAASEFEFDENIAPEAKSLPFLDEDESLTSSALAWNATESDSFPDHDEADDADTFSAPCETNAGTASVTSSPSLEFSEEADIGSQFEETKLQGNDFTEYPAEEGIIEDTGFASADLGDKRVAAAGFIDHESDLSCELQAEESAEFTAETDFGYESVRTEYVFDAPGNEPAAEDAVDEDAEPVVSNNSRALPDWWVEDAPSPATADAVAGEASDAEVVVNDVIDEVENDLSSSFIDSLNLPTQDGEVRGAAESEEFFGLSNDLESEKLEPITIDDAPSQAQQDALEQLEESAHGNVGSEIDIQEVEEEFYGLGADEPAESEEFTQPSSLLEHQLEIEDEPLLSSSLDSQTVGSATPATSDAIEEEDSVEDYMRKLLARMRGVPEDQIELPNASTPPAKPATAPTPPPPKPITKSAESTDRPAPVTTSNAPATVGETADVTAAFDPEKYVPRGLATEGNNNLAAMRELANSSARTAINTSTRQKHVTSVLLKLSISGIGIVVAVTLLAINGLAVNIGLIATFASIIVAVIWGYDGITSLKPLLRSELILKPQIDRSDNAPRKALVPEDSEANA